MGIMNKGKARRKIDAPLKNHDSMSPNDCEKLYENPGEICLA